MNRNLRCFAWRLSAAAGSLLLLAPALALGAGSAIKIAPHSTQAAQVGEPDRSLYVFRTIDVAGGVYTAIEGINDNRMAVGSYCTDSTCLSTRSFLWRNGQTELLPYDADVVYMIDLNNLNQAFGTVGSNEILYAAIFEVSTGAWTLLPDIPGKPLNYGMRMNQTGYAVGQACEGTWAVTVNCVSWIWNGKSYEFFPRPGTNENWTGTWCINDWGQFAGSYLDASGHLHGYVGHGKQLTHVDVPGATDTRSDDNNNLGDVIGNGYFADGSSQIYMWRKGEMTLLPGAEGAVNSYSWTINDIRDYGGQWYDSDGNWHGFIAFRQ